MSGRKFDYERLNRASRLRSNGFEPVDDPKGPKVQLPTRTEELVSGLFKAAKARTKADRETLAELEKQYALWMKAPDISSIEVDKLRRKISRIKASLPAEKNTRANRKRARLEKNKNKRFTK